MSLCTIGWASMPGTGCWIWRAGPGSRSSWPASAAEKVGNQAVMVSLGRPGAGEQLLQSHGFADIERLDVPFAWEFADPELYVSSGRYRTGL
jgi:hypothetical protein